MGRVCQVDLRRAAVRVQVSSRTRAQLDVLQQRWLQPQMVLLDVGMATEMNDEDQRNMVGLFR
jgi:aarF domain-containing kinase